MSLPLESINATQDETGKTSTVGSWTAPRAGNSNDVITTLNTRHSSPKTSVIRDSSFVSTDNFMSCDVTNTSFVSPFSSDITQISPITSDGFLISPCVSDISMTSPTASETSPSGSDSSASSCGGKPPITQFNFPVPPWALLSPRNVVPVPRHHIPIGQYSPSVIPIPVSGYSPHVLLPPMRLPIPTVSPIQVPWERFYGYNFFFNFVTFKVHE